MRSIQASNRGDPPKEAAALKTIHADVKERTSAVGAPNEEPVRLLHVARLDHVPEHSVGLKGQLSGRADDDARRPVAVRPLHIVQALPGWVGWRREGGCQCRRRARHGRTSDKRQATSAEVAEGREAHSAMRHQALTRWWTAYSCAVYRKQDATGGHRRQIAASSVGFNLIARVHVCT